MIGTWQPVIGTIIAALIAFGGVWLTQRNSRKNNSADLMQRIIDQVQEERDRAQDRADKGEAKFEAAIASLKAELAEVRAELIRVIAREQVVVEHAWQLRRHINEQLSPPPPPWPKELS
jgi:septal ring factor EnvC (AmiA/AmiB activator)